jgi:hypothetical protein
MQNRLDLIHTRFDEPLFVLGGTVVTVASVVSSAVFVLAAYAASWLLRRVYGSAALRDLRLRVLHAFLPVP